MLREVSLNLLWSKTASNHRHVSAELLEGIHLTRFSEKIIGGMVKGNLGILLIYIWMQYERDTLKTPIDQSKSTGTAVRVSNLQKLEAMHAN